MAMDMAVEKKLTIRVSREAASSPKSASFLYDTL